MRKPGLKKRFRRFRRKKRFSRISRPRRNFAVHFFKRAYQLEEFTYAAGGAKTYSLRLSDLPNYSEFVNMFDEYCVTKWVIQIYYAGTDSDVINTTTNGIGMIGSVYDYTDTAGPGSFNELREYPSYRERQIVRCHPWTRAFVPKVNEMVYRSVGTTGYMVKAGKNPWLTTDTPDVPHFGFKMFLDTPPGNASMKIRVNAIAYLKFKSVK